MPASSLATPMQISPQAIYNWEGGRNSPTTDNLLTIANLLAVEPNAFMRGEVVLLSDEIDESRPSAKRQATPREVELVPNPPTLRQMFGEHDVEELGHVVGGEDGDFTLNGEVIATHARPITLRGRKVFAIRVKGTSMEPKHEEGDLLYVEWNREPRLKEDGVFELYADDPDGETRGFIKRLVAKGMGVVVVEQFNPQKQFTYPRDRVKAIHRVVPWREVAGVM